LAANAIMSSAEAIHDGFRVAWNFIHKWHAQQEWQGMEVIIA